MLSATMVVAALSFLDVEALAANQAPAVIAKMEELGTVYLTRQDPRAKVKTSSRYPKPNAIIGIDFRPMAGTDPKKIAEVLSELTTVPHLQTILLLGKDVTDEAIEALPVRLKLTSIQLHNTSVTDKGVATLTQFVGLQRFIYTGMNLTDVGMKELVRFRALHTIEITDAKITDQGVLALRRMYNLRRVIFENTLASQSAVDRLKESFADNLDGGRIFG